MVTPFGHAEAGSVRLDVVTAPSFIDVRTIADPEPLLVSQPELFVEDWTGESEVVALIKEPGEIAAAGVLRFQASHNSLEAYVIGEIRDDVCADVLKKALRARVAERREKLPEADRVRTTIYWGKEPPTLAVDKTSEHVGVNGFRAKTQKHDESLRSFMEDLMSPYGPLSF